MASFLSEDFIEEVQLANDIFDVISEYLPLKSKGKNYFGLCPFHNEKTASFSVDTEKQLYHCFGCGEGGNVFTFIMALERLDFLDSVKFLADRKGISLPNASNYTENEEAKLYNLKIIQVNRDVAMYYHKQLSSNKGMQSLEYLKSRGIDYRTIRVFGIGFAPDSWNDTMNYLLEKGYEEKFLVDAGLVIEKNQRTYDRFRNRIMFPIIDHRDRVLGFGGRVMDEGVPKYLNSSENPIFNKSNMLFGINLARKQRPIESLIIVEGYLDVISLYQFGFKNVLASLGTALTLEQAKIMRRYTKNIYIAYDGDVAGQKATSRGLDILKEAGCNAKVIEFPNKMDPDDTIRKYGVEYFQKLYKNALSMTDYKLNQLELNYDLDNQEERVEFATKASEELLKLENPLERDVYIHKINASTGFKPELLYRLIEQLENRMEKRVLKKNIIGKNRYTRNIRKANLKEPLNIKAEKHLIRLSIENPNFSIMIIEKLQGIHFQDEINSKVFNIIKDLVEKNIEINTTRILDLIEDDNMKNKVIEIFQLEMEYDNVDRYILDCIEVLKLSQTKERIKKLNEIISRMDREGDHDSIEYKKAQKEMAEITRRAKLGQ